MTARVFLVACLLSTLGGGATAPPQQNVYRAEYDDQVKRAGERFTAGDLDGSVAVMREMANVARERGHTLDQAWAVKQISYYARTFGDFDLMLSAAKGSFALYLAAGPEHENEGWLTLANTYAALNAPKDAAEAFDRAQALQGPEYNGQILELAAQQYARAGDLETAIARLEAAAAREASARTPNRLMRCLANAAAFHAQLGHRQPALELVARVEAMLAAAPAGPYPAVVRFMGVAHAHLGDRGAAVRYLDRAREAVDLTDTGALDQLRDLGEAYLRVGAADRAIECYTEALTLAEQVQVPLRQARLRAFRAAAEREAGALEAARADLEAALPLFDAVRNSVSRPQLRTEYFSTIQRHYGLYVDVLMRLHARTPDAGFDRRALEASDARRARLLADTLLRGGIGTPRATDPLLVKEEAALRSRLTRALNRQEDQFSASGKKAIDTTKKLTGEVRELEIRLDELRGRMEASDPSAAALLRPEQVTFEAIQRQMASNDVVLLEYALGETASHLFVVTADTLQTFTLPPQKVIEAAARRLHATLSRRPAGNAAPSDRAGLALGEMIVGPVQSIVQGRKLAIVAEGALQYVPFTMLPQIARAEIAYLPSAAVLVLQREQTATRRRPTKGAAVFADPVFGADDGRVQGVGSSSVAAADRGASLQRLSFSFREAQAVATSLGQGRVKLSVGFAATKQAAMAPDLADFRILHFATHGIVDSANGTGSALILSQVDRRGHSLDGRLGLHDIYSLRVNAELVVLSACETALGEDVRGEGLIGLTRGFMYAGAQRVLASLWKVDDGATSELMKAFYAELRQPGVTPATALVRAQAAIRTQARWQRPYYWAGFQLHGDWQ